MTDDDFEDLDLEPDDDSDDHVRLSKADVKRMRAAARRAGAAERELATFRRQDAVRKAGIDGLTERQINAIASEAGPEADAEQMRQIAVEFGWATAQDDEQQKVAAEVDAAEQAVNATTGGTPNDQRTGVSPEEINGWPIDKQMRLNNQHPDLYELLLRGEPISLPAGFN